MYPGRRYSQDELIPCTSTQSTGNNYCNADTCTSETDENSYEIGSDHREETDGQACEEDQFRDTHNVPFNSTDPKEEEPCYHPEQEEMATVIVERIKEILFRNGHSRRSLEAYKQFEFEIYTASSKMLERQTISRLCDKNTKCFSQETYRDASELNTIAEKKVHTFSVDNIEKAHKKLEAEVKENPDTLYLIVADEAHSAITKETTKKKESSVNNTVVNSWDSVHHPNVIVLQVSIYLVIVSSVSIIHKVHLLVGTFWDISCLLFYLL